MLGTSSTIPFAPNLRDGALCALGPPLQRGPLRGYPGLILLGDWGGGKTHVEQAAALKRLQLKSRILFSFFLF